VRSAFVSDDVAGRRSPPLALLLVAVAATAGSAVFAKALLLEQPASPRIALIATVAAVGAILAFLPLAALARLLARGWAPMLRAALAALWMAFAFMPATMFAFAVENRIIEGHVEADSVLALGARDLFWTMFGGMGLFTPTGLQYLWPWPLAAVALITGICFYLWPQPRA
jgi:hypothetical protein